MISSGALAIKYIKENGLNKVFIIGSQELKSAFIKAGINVCTEDENETMVIGIDDSFDYSMMTIGLRAAIRAKKIIVCNQDRSFEKEDGLFPGNGGIVSSILYCSNKAPDFVIGKPNTFMLEHVLEKYHLCKEELLVIGDSEESDIAMAETIGCKSILIGHSNEKEQVIKGLYETINFDWTRY